MTTKTKKASRTRRSASAKPAKEVHTRLIDDPAKDAMMRRWAGKILSDLPSGFGDSLVVLKYAERLIYWAVIDDEPLSPKGRRAAR